ncbi:hypothetical protein [Streptomyces scabiei]|uniref:hypothetical protein n=1 Tax=Streptomyces scabiei TaxID=1930 RepID=UPI0029B63356|nr:hypothetical protein [Streptomyces scabiei]MDX2802730.1 hypothetical protein [Streptomyces scabiei]
MATFTTRELRSIAAILDGLNKARGHNTRMGVPTTPDVFTARFPTGLVAVLRWTEALHSDDPKQQRALELRARHRSGYVLDLDTPPDPANAFPLQDPQPAKRHRAQLREVPTTAVRGEHGPQSVAMTVHLAKTVDPAAVLRSIPRQEGATA